MKIMSKSYTPKLVIDVPGGSIKSDQWIPRDTAAVFRFFSEPGNLELLTPPFLNFKIQRVSTALMQEATEIDYKLKLHGLPIRWRSRILGWKPPLGFSDMQLIGPYRYWHHRHLFEAENKGTWIRDRVDFSLPLHFLSRRLVGAYVKADLERIFGYRQKAVSSLFKESFS